jgi:hypothetical protein
VRNGVGVSDELTTRFSELVRRELGASQVLVARGDDPPQPGAVVVPLSDGGRVEARFDAGLEDVEAVTRRLEILVRAFESVLVEQAPVPKKRAPVAVSLHDELRAVAMRCGAVDALVIDAHSPVLWASATQGTTADLHAEATIPDEARNMLRIVRESHRGALTALGRVDAETFSVVVPDLDGPWDPGPAANETTVALAARVLAKVRALPQVATLHRGGHLAHTESEGDLAYVARGFAGIYVLVLLFEAAPDEIRVERSLRDALPRIERLVLALPPQDPDPVPAGAIALRPRRKR